MADDPKQELGLLISETFTKEELRGFVGNTPLASMIGSKLAWEWTSIKELSHQLIQDSEAAKALNSALIGRLMAHRPEESGRLIELAKRAGPPLWVSGVDSQRQALGGLLAEALPLPRLAALIPAAADEDTHVDGVVLTKTVQSIADMDELGRLTPSFFQTLLNELPGHRPAVLAIAALWDIDAEGLEPAPPPPTEGPSQRPLASKGPSKGPMQQHQSLDNPAPIDLTETPPPHPGVLVVGSASVFPEHVAQAAQAVGQALAQLKLTLITGDSSGVDLGVTRAFVDRSRALGQPARLLKVVTPQWPELFEGGETLRRADAAEESVRRASLVVLLHGGEGTRQLHDLALGQGTPVLPLAATGPLAQAIFDAMRREGRRPKGLSARDFAQLQELPSAAGLGHLLQLALARAPSTLTPTRAHAPLTADHPDAHPDDLLDVGRQAEVFADALAARAVSPPLAIGLLGEWGSGKSFFMKELRARVKLRADSQDSAFYRNICQVEFNAWHYVDANPWASLADRIFSGIAEHLFGSEQEQLERRREQLRARLESTKQEQEAAEAQEREWEAKLKSARAALEAKVAAEQEKLRGLSALLDRRVWRQLRERDSVKTLRGEAEAAAKRMGIDLDIPDEELPAGVDKLQAQVARARVAVTQIKAVPGAIGALGAMRWPNTALGWFLMLAVPFGGLALLVLLSFLEKPWWAQVSTLIGQLVVFMAFIGERAWKFVEGSRAIVGFVEAVSAESEAVRQAILDDPTQDILDAQAALAIAEEAAEAARAELTHVQQRLAETRQQLDDLRAGKLAYDFIRDAGGSYRAQQGVVSKVRRDLETLRARLEDWREEARAANAQGAGVQVPAPIDRIILYIDDLDRCRPPQVVQVLQAVHLLLAFDLFMVVVGVDPRWLERALESEYSALLHSDLPRGGAPGRGSLPAATPRDYLEKIFQVPYTLPVVDEGGFTRLMQRLLPDREEVEAAMMAEAEAETAPGAEPNAAEEGEEAAATAEASGSTEAAPASESGPPPLPPEAAPSHAAEARAESSVSPTTPEESQGPPPEPPYNPGSPQRFFIEPWERQFLSRLSPLVYTPRDIIRFVNIYRLLRISAPDYEAFAQDGREGYHRVVQLLLAVNVGCPELGAWLLPLLAQRQRLHIALRSDAPTVTQLLLALEPQGDEPRPLLEELAALSPRGRQQLEVAGPLLRSLAGDVPDSLAPWSLWAPRVARYSFGASIGRGRA